MGGGESKPEVYSPEQVTAMLEKKDTQKHAELMQAQMDHQAQLAAQKDQQLAEFMNKWKEDAKEHKALNEKLLEKQAQAMAAQKAAEDSKLKDLEGKMAELARIAELAKTDKVKAAQEGAALSSKIAKLEQEKLDWKKAEEEKTEQLMKESPPPFALKKNPPANKPLYTEDYPCFAIMGRNGTGKSSMINTLTGAYKGPDYQTSGAKRQKNGAQHLRVGALTETTMGEPPPVFMKTTGGTTIALFDRPGHGAKAAAKAGNTHNFIADQGLKWWTGIVLLTDRASVPEETLIFQLCQSIGTPILVARNKIVEDLQKEKEEKAYTGEEFTEEKAITQIRDHLDEIQMDGKAAKIVDAHHPGQYQFNELVEWLDKLSKKQ